MDLQPAILWWLAAGALVALELATGTIYLLAMAIGLVAAAVTAHAGGQLPSQWLMAAVVGGGAVWLWHRRRLAHPGPQPQLNPDLNLDIGARVLVPGWSTDGSARVQYRGAAWSARAVGGPPAPGWHRIQAIDGALLLLEPERDRP